MERKTGWQKQYISHLTAQQLSGLLHRLPEQIIGCETAWDKLSCIRYLYTAAPNPSPDISPTEWLTQIIHNYNEDPHVDTCHCKGSK